MSADIVDLKPFLLKDLKTLYKNLEKDNNNDYNVIIKVEQTNFKADSVILKVRSEYFRNLINNELKKMANIFSKRITLEISDISPKFSLQEEDEVIFDLFVTAEKLKLIDMVDYLQNYLIEKKTSWIENNLIKVYQTSLKSISFRDLQYYCDAIIKRKPELIFISNVFHTLERTILLNLIKREDAFLSEVEIWSSLTKWVHEQEPPIDKDPRKWNTSDILEFVKRITDFVPYIRFFTISSEDYFSCVRPYKDALPQNLVEDLEKYYLVRKGSSPPPGALPPRMMKRKSSMYFQSPTETNTPNTGLQRRGTALAKPPKVNRSVSMKPVSSLINIRQIKRISRWIYGNESGDSYTKNFLLLAKGNRDSLTKESFHSLCDNKGPTLILARIDNTNEIIGGYNPNPWTSSNSWKMSNDSFIFSFKSDGSGIDSTIFSKVINPDAAIFDGSSDMDVSFGLDLLLFGEEYKHEHYEKRIMDCDNFKIKDFEVFQVKKNSSA
ncbi:hypothetical protein RclHR1_04990009 [Rhizophagus clarus]|uniref:TLDc domain-containing protein n=1 Tax=Rhizophagus clarus TaxID=94130 RepID=A0A2Z6RK32_9GLOM|nr:hypothetical protein RclHR1_04990009 [Rhizophagus clarus]